MKTNTVEEALLICIKLDIFYANLPNLLLICQASECFFFFFNEDEWILIGAIYVWESPPKKQITLSIFFPTVNIKDEKK